MAWDLEELIARLLTFIACAGEEGCLLSHLICVLRLPPDPSDGASSHQGGWYVLPQYFGGPLTDDGLSTIWDWLVQRADVSVGRDRKFNTLPLREALSLAGLPLFDQQGNDDEAGGKKPQKVSAAKPSSSKVEDLRIFASQETMWEAITGHSVDYKRVPRSEWLLLLGIASRKDQGILQGDLCRLVEQDKRSVPKRTDALVRKGYITKRTTLVRGTKTSKLWLKAFTPPPLRDAPDAAFAAQQPDAEMNLSPQVLATNLEPVPWHSRWSGESVDYTALLTTIMATCKEWDVMRLQDLKSKLGVLGMRWQMKVVSKVCRFLNARDAIRYVAAKLDNKVFKDCIRYNRDLDTKDWSIFLSTGKRPGKPSRYLEFYTDGSNRADLPANPQAGASRLDAVPPWSVDQPLPVTVARAIMVAGEAGLTNPDVYGLTMGSSFTRFLSSMTIAISTPCLQPAHLKHLQVKSEHSRVGKVASYRYSMQSPPVLDLTNQVYGFSPPAQPLRAGKLDEICSAGPSRPKPRGRPRKQRMEEATSPSRNAQGGPERLGIVQESGAREANTPEDNQQDTAALENATLENPSQRDIDDQESSALEVSRGPRRRGRPTSLIIRIRMPSSLLRTCLTGVQTAQSKDQLMESPDARRGFPAAVAEAEDAEEGVEDGGQQDKQPDDLALPNGDHQQSQAGPCGVARGRGRGRGRRRGNGRGRGEARDEGTSKSKSWSCDKCEGVWKNDIGLKYHLEKSRTMCNPSWDPAAVEEKRRVNAESKSSRDLATEVGAPPALRPRRGKRKSMDETTLQRLSQEPSDEENSLEVATQRRPKYRKFVPETPAKLSSFTSGQNPLRGLTNQPRQIRGLQSRLRGGDETAAHPGSHMEVGGQITAQGSRALRSIDLDQYGPDLVPRVWSEEREQETPIKSDPHRDRTPRSTPNERTPRARKAPRHELADRIAALIHEMLQIHEGVLPGGNSLWRALTAVWDATYLSEPMPKLKDCQRALSHMLKTKQVKEHWHGFQGRNGLFSKCQILSLPHLNAFAPESLNVLDRIRQSHPALFVPQVFLTLAPAVETQERRENRRGRRVLAGEVADLDAPVYAAQIAAKRGSELEDSPPSPKRRRLVSKTAAVSRESYEEDHDPVPGVDGRDVSAPSHDQLPTLRVDDGGVQFLVPNTFLDEHERPSIAAAKAVIQPEAQGRVDLAIDPQLFASNAEESAIPRPKSSRGRRGLWSALVSDHFEANNSLSMSGWMPDSRRFSWGEFAQELGKQFSSEQDASPNRGGFEQKLEACVNLELAWMTPFLEAQDLAAGPHDLFVNMIEGSKSRPCCTDLSWPADGQLTIASATRLRDLDESDDDTGDIENLVIEATAGRMRRAEASLEASEDQRARMKRVALVTRALSAIPSAMLVPETGRAVIAAIDKAQLLAAFIAIRVLVGGADKAIDWGLLVRLFPAFGLEELRRFWSTACKGQASYIRKFTRTFQARLIEAFENDELPIPDFENLEVYDWPRVIRWTMTIPRQEGFWLPQTRELLDNRYTLDEVRVTGEDWREKFFHVQASIFSRFEAVTSKPAAGGDTLPIGVDGDARKIQVRVAKSWIKSLCCTEDVKSADLIKRKFLALSEDADSSARLLQAAVDDLTRERVINRSKKPPLGGRPYKLSEWYTSTLAKVCQRSKYEEAAAFKAQMDGAFRRHGELEVSYTLDDGAMMALTNLHAAGRIRIVLIDVPNIPFGFEPGNYESRKFPKSYYHFRLKALPRNSYLYDEEIDVLRAACREDLPLVSARGEIPQWVDFFGGRDIRRWSEILGAYCFAYATRGSMTTKGICSALKPVLEEFEAELIEDWGKSTGIVQPMIQDMGITVGEWWWLAVPWQQKRGW